MPAFIAPFVVILVVLLLVAGIRRGADIGVRIDGDKLVIDIRGADIVLALCRRIVVPVSQVKGVAVSDLADVPRQGMRLPGTSWPGVIRAGSYGTGDARSFWDVRKGPQVLWIEFEPGFAYQRAILEVSDPHARLLELRPTLGAWVPTDYLI
mgnify:FL=1